MDNDINNLKKSIAGYGKIIESVNSIDKFLKSDDGKRFLQEEQKKLNKGKWKRKIKRRCISIWTYTKVNILTIIGIIIGLLSLILTYKLFLFELSH